MTDKKRKKIEIIDESQDQKYFTITPRLVWALSRNTFDYTLWGTIKGIAGDSGECYLATPDLAILAMMSTGQASDSRRHWIKLNMLEGNIYRDPGYPQPVWHLKIPNIWAANLAWAEKFPGLKDRVEFKRTQMFELRLERALQKEKSLQEVKPSPGEGGGSPDERGLTPDETKDIKKDIQKESVPADADTPRGMINPNTGNHTDAIVKGDRMDGFLWAAGLAAQHDAELITRINGFPPDCQATLRTLVDHFNWQASTIPEDPKKKGGTFAQWIMEIREINTQVGDFGQQGVLAACKACTDLTISHPAGITWAIAGELGKLAGKLQKKQAYQKNELTPFEKALQEKSASPDDERIKNMGQKLREKSV